MNVILFSVGSGGDVMPFVQIGRRLAQRGHRVTLLSHCRYAENARRSGLDFVPLDNAAEHARFVADQPLLNSPAGIPEFLRRHSLANAIDHCQRIAQASRPGNTVIVTRDLFDTAARLAAEKLGAALCWIFGNPLQATTWQLKQQLFAGLLRADIDRLRGALGLPQAHETFWAYGPSPQIALWPEWFGRGGAEFPFALAPVGFVQEDDADRAEMPLVLQQTLRTTDAVLITAGTGMYLGADFYAAGAEACRRLNIPGILVAQHREQLPGDYPGSIKWIGYLPFGKLMAQVKAVIHHGGIGTLACAMAAGIPQLVLPKGADRPDNASRLKELQIADFLPPPKWQPAVIAQTLDRLLQSPTVQENCRDLAGRLKDSDSVGAACEVIERAGHS